MRTVRVKKRKPKRVKPRKVLPPLLPAVPWTNSPADLRWAQRLPRYARKPRYKGPRLIVAKKIRSPSNRMTTKVVAEDGIGSVNGAPFTFQNYLVTELTIPAGLSAVQGDKKFPNPFEFTKKRFRGWTGAVTTQEYSLAPGASSPTFRFVNSHTGPNSPSTDWGGAGIPHSFAITEERAIRKVYDQLDSGLNLAVDVLEGKQTAKMLLQVLRLKKVGLEFLASTIFPNSLKGRGKTVAAERAEYLSKRWLENRYGVTPFVSSVVGVVNELNREFTGAPIVVRGRASQPSDRISSSGSGTYSLPRISTVETCRSRTEFVCAFQPNAMDPTLARWTSLSARGLAWELFPFSFVFDWGVNVGAYLTELESIQRYQKHLLYCRKSNSYLKTKSESKQGSTKDSAVFWPDGQPVVGSGRTQIISLTANVRETYLKRTVSYTLPEARPPGVHLNMNLNRVIDSFSLLSVVSRTFNRKLYG